MSNHPSIMVSVAVAATVWVHPRIMAGAAAGPMNNQGMSNHPSIMVNAAKAGGGVYQCTRLHCKLFRAIAC